MVCLIAPGKIFKRSDGHYNKVIKWAGKLQKFIVVCMAMRWRLKTRTALSPQPTPLKATGTMGPGANKKNTPGGKPWNAENSGEKGRRRRTRGASCDINPKSQAGPMRYKPWDSLTAQKENRKMRMSRDRRKGRSRTIAKPSRMTGTAALIPSWKGQRSALIVRLNATCPRDLGSTRAEQEPWKVGLMK